MSTVEMLRGKTWVKFATFTRTADAVLLLPAMARQQGCPVRCWRDGSHPDAPIPHSVHQCASNNTYVCHR